MKKIIITLVAAATVLTQQSFLPKHHDEFEEIE
jgi:hypothetical protein